MRRSALHRTGLVTAVFALITVAACKQSGDVDAAAAPSVTTSTTTTVSASPSASDGPSTIPGAALLQPADLSGAGMKPVDGDTGRDLRPPRPCGVALPSDPNRVASIATTALLPSPGGGESTTPSVILETIVRYKPGTGAQAYQELVTDLAKCPGKAGPDSRSWEYVGKVDAGDEATFFLTTTEARNDDGAQLVPWIWPTAVARVGDYLVLVSDLGWEAMNGEEESVRRLIVAAAARVQAAS